MIIYGSMYYMWSCQTTGGDHRFILIIYISVNNKGSVTWHQNKVGFILFYFICMNKSIENGIYVSPLCSFNHWGVQPIYVSRKNFTVNNIIKNVNCIFLLSLVRIKNENMLKLSFQNPRHEPRELSNKTDFLFVWWTPPSFSFTASLLQHLQSYIMVR